MNVLLGGIAFALCSAVPSLLLSGTILYTQTPRRPSAFDDFLVVLYLAGVTAAISTVGFLIPTALSRPWRVLPQRRALIYSSICGLISPGIYLSLVMVGAIALNALFKSSYAWLGLAIAQGAPGLLLGGLAHVLARIRQ